MTLHNEHATCFNSARATPSSYDIFCYRHDAGLESLRQDAIEEFQTAANTSEVREMLLRAGNPSAHIFDAVLAAVVSLLFGQHQC